MLKSVGERGGREGSVFEDGVVFVGFMSSSLLISSALFMGDDGAADAVVSRDVEHGLLAFGFLACSSFSIGRGAGYADVVVCFSSSCSFLLSVIFGCRESGK